jgi:hypothetical protein
MGPVLPGCRDAVRVLALSVALVACGGPSGHSSATSSSTGTPARCLVRLHGKGGRGAGTTAKGGVTIMSPAGNAEGWGGRQWLYFPDEEYTAARKVISGAIAGCGQVIVDGFSNGAAFAAKLYCRGETFGGHLVRVVVDDPVVDGAVEGCSPGPSVGLTLYWTGALEAQSQPGWQCAKADWTCEGGATIGIRAYAEALHTGRRDSPYHKHQWFLDAPELSEWR